MKESLWHSTALSTSCVLLLHGACVRLYVTYLIVYVNVLFFSTFHFHPPFLITEEHGISQMQEYCEGLLQKAKDQLEVLREQANMTHQDLKRTQNWYVCCLKVTDTVLFKVGES